MTDQPILGPVNGTKVPRYAGAPTFGRLPRVDEVSRHDVAVLGAPFDGGVSFRPGARFGTSLAAATAAYEVMCSMASARAETPRARP